MLFLSISGHSIPACHPSSQERQVDGRCGSAAQRSQSDSLPVSEGPATWLGLLHQDESGFPGGDGEGVSDICTDRG